MPIDPGTAMMITGGANVGQGLFSLGQAKKQREWASNESQKAYNRQLEIMNLQNEYNSPKSQMARFAAAGLNPALMYQQGNSGNTAVSSPEYSPAEGTFPAPDFGIPNSIQMYQDYRLKNQTISNQKVLQEKINQEISNLALEAGLKRQTAKMNQNTLLFDLRNKYETMMQNTYQTANMKLHGKKTVQEIENLITTNLKTLAEEKNINQQTEYTRRLIPKIQSDIDLQTTMSRKMMTEIDMNRLLQEWQKLKYNKYTKENINIDMDKIWPRTWKGRFNELGSEAQKVQSRIKKGYNKVMNFKIK